jgi:nucleolar MIF4G domain-containing protein 1
MLETLANLKNNKIKRAAMHQAGGDTVERLKKFLAGLGKIRHCTPFSTWLTMA